MIDNKLETQIDKLATYIIDEFPDFHDRDEGAVGCAIRLLKFLKLEYNIPKEIQEQK